MQRGLIITFAASMNNARDRVAGSEIVSKVDGDCNPLRSVCAAPCTNTSVVAQPSKVTRSTIRMEFDPSLFAFP